jgi:hypothetical protein
MITNNDTKEQELKMLETKAFAKNVISSAAYKSLTIDAKIILLLMLRKMHGGKPEGGSYDN